MPQPPAFLKWDTLLYGGKVDIREGKNGQYGVCLFPDGKECDEWALYKGALFAYEVGLRSRILC